MSTVRREIHTGNAGTYSGGTRVELAGRTRRRRTGPGGLTRREIEVLHLVSRGWTNRAVARTLWVTDETVKFHLSNIYRKLGVSNRIEASRWAAERGIAERAIEIASLDLSTT